MEDPESIALAGMATLIGKKTERKRREGSRKHKTELSKQRESGKTIEEGKREQLSRNRWAIKETVQKKKTCHAKEKGGKKIQ